MADPGHDALRHVDQALTARPKRDGPALAAALQGLAAFRDRLAERHRREATIEGRRPLDHVNAAISIVMAAAFPIGEVQWDELAKARGWLAAVLREGGVQ